MTRLRTDEERHTDTCLVEAVYYGSEEVSMVIDCPATIGGQSPGRIGHQSHLLRTHRADEIEEAIGGIPLDVELRGHDRTQISHILIGDMTSIGTRMHGDTLCSKLLTATCRQHHIRSIATASIAYGGYLIDIYTELSH